MYKEKILSVKNLENFNFEETKKKVNNYFLDLETLEWEVAKLDAQKGMSTEYDLSVEYRKQSYSPRGKDEFNLCAREEKEEQLKRYLASYSKARSVLSDKERIYIVECFVNRKFENEIVKLLGYSSCDGNGFRILKKSAIYKFADFLGLVVKK